MAVASRLALVQRWLDALPEDIREIYRDDELRASLKPLIRPHLADGFHIVLVGPEGSGFEERHEGYEGFIDGWDTWSAPYSTYLFEAASIEEVGNAVVVDGTQTATPIGSNEPITMRIASVWVFEGERIVRAEFHLDPERAHSDARAT